MSELEEYQAIVSKLLDRTAEGKVSWQVHPFKAGFTASLRESSTSFFEFMLLVTGPSTDRTISLTTSDELGHELFNVVSTVFPTSAAEEKLSESLEKLYDAARRQALKIPEKIKVVSDLLDRA